MKLLLSICTMGLFYAGFAQQIPAVKLTTPAPQTPEAAALGKFGDIPVGYYTGVPKIELPIYTIQSGSLSLPISLSYHAGGVKVEDVATWVGMGWSLNAGGAINRMMRGLPDESAWGFLSTGYQVDQWSSMTPAQRLVYYQSLVNGTADSQQDIFSYATTSGGGKFFYDKSGRIFTIPQSKSKIQYGNYSGKQGWKVVEPDGIQYFFTSLEESFSTTTTAFGGSSPAPFYNPSSWFISKILSANQKDSIVFEYDQIIYSNVSLATIRKNIALGGFCDNYMIEVNYGITSYLGLFLKKISFKNGVINFERDQTIREDLPNTNRLKYINVVNANNVSVKKIELHHSFTNSPDPGYYVSPTSEYLRKRMFLDSVSQWAGAARNLLVKYNYINRHLLPIRLSYNQDHWGFFNGVTNNSATLPYCFISPFNPKQFYLGADRDPNIMYCTAGTLQSMVYPTGGKSSFEYESNDISNFASVASTGLDLRDTALRFQMYGDPAGQNTNYDQTFSIVRGYGSSGGVIGVIKIGLPGAASQPPPPIGVDDPYITLRFPDNSTVTLRNNTTLFLPVGTYQLSADLSNNPDPNLIRNFFITIDCQYGILDNPEKLKKTVFGGLRVKRIINNDGNTDNVRQFIYTDSLGVSTGAANNFPFYTTDTPITIVKPSCNTCIFKSISSVSLGGLALTQGSTVGYERVTELNGNAGEGGKSEYTFTNPKSNPDWSTASSFPYPPETSFDWVRGMQLSQTVFKKANGNYVKVQEKKSNYELTGYDTFSVSKTGLKVEKAVYDQCGSLSFGGEVDYDTYYSIDFYQNKTSFPKLLSDTTRIYDQNNSVLVSQTITNYQYSANNLQPASLSSINSNGDRTIENRKYSGDYQFTASPTQSRAAVLKTMLDKNYLNAIVEKTNFKQTGSQATRLTNSAYNSFNPNHFCPDTVYTLPVAAPTTSFTPAVNISNALGIDSRYNAELIYQLFDGVGNVQQAVDKLGVVTTFLYGYDNAYPVAKLAGITYSQVSGIVNQALLNNISVTDQALRNEINRVKSLLPANALVTTYTYAPLIGITSQTDPNGRTTYYEYDAFNRLKRIKDHDGNTVKVMDYQYQKPITQ